MTNLERSPTWAGLSKAIGEQYRAGVPFERIHEMNIAIKMGTLAPYEKHRAALDRLVWYDDPAPKRIIEVGPGYGAMGQFWPADAVVYNVDLPEMLPIQQDYHASLFREKKLRGHYDYVPFTDADRLNFEGAYLFSTWALTETTPETWEFYIDKAPQLAGAYIVGWRGWIDLPDYLWPWERLRDAFKTVRSDLTPYLDYDGEPTDSLELAAVNR